MLQKSIFFLSLLIAKVALGFDSSSNSNVALYWGQNSEGSQERLSTYCQSDSVDIVILSFLSSFPNLELNFANQCSTTFSDGLLHCSNIAEDIKTCQSLGKIVLLSLGGATGNYGFTSDSEATNFAETLWNKFGGGSDDERPFDDAVIDGFDFDIENQQQTGYPALGNALRTYFAKDTSKTYYLSAAPQCPYPDQSVGSLLSEVDIDFAFVQFYNNYCDLGSNFNWNTWADYATGTSPNKDIKIFVGLPAGPTAASYGYSSASVVSSYIDSIKSQSMFGGISLWDASAAWANTDGNQNFADQMKEIIDSGSTSSSAITSSTSTTSTSTSSTSTTSSLVTSSSTSSKLTLTTSSTSSSDKWLPEGTTYSTAFTSTLSSGTAYTSTSSTGFTSTLSTGTAYTSTKTSVYTSPLNPANKVTTPSTSDIYLPEAQETSQKPPSPLTTTKNAVTTLTTKLINNSVKVFTYTASPEVETVTQTNYVKTITSVVTGPPS